MPMNKALKIMPLLFFISIISLIGNFFGFGISPFSAAPGMMIILLIAFMGVLLSEIIKIKKIPSIIYISILGVILTAPFSPLKSLILPFVDRINFLSIATPILACAGISLGSEVRDLKKQGLKMLFVSILVFTGTFLGSAIIAEIALRLFRK